MKHIRFITSNKPVCSKPDNLGHDFVVVDFAPEDKESCEPCLQLTMAHNKLQYEREMMISPVMSHVPQEEPWDPSKSFWGGLLVGVTFMLIMGVAFYMNFGH